MAAKQPGDRPVLKPDENVWRIERADRAAVIVDAADYYRIIRAAMANARHSILLIGWDFDTRIVLDRSDDAEAPGETLGAFLLAIARNRPAIRIDILKWDVGSLKIFGRGAMFLTLIRWALTKPIRFKLDSAHPPGCSHHQKIVVIDGALAVCGGIDMTQDRWDTPAHRDDDPKRLRPNGKPYGPWHDATMIVDGAAARALGELSRDRWKRATGKALPPIESDTDPWPEALAPMFRDVEVGIARTRADYQECGEVREVEALFLDLIKSAKRFIYAENQYFTSRKIGEAIAARMAEPDPPEIVIVGPKVADGWLEQKAMDGARVRLARAIGQVDKANRFRIYYPVTAAGAPIYVHAKVMIVDDLVLRVGSSNMNNRSLGLDSECDLVVADGSAAIEALRTRLLAEHLGVDEAAVAQRFAETGSLIATIEALRGDGRTLKPLTLEQLGAAEKFIADNELLDPEDPDGFFEPLTRRGLFRGWRKRFGAWRDRRKPQPSGRKSGTER